MAITSVTLIADGDGNTQHLYDATLSKNGRLRVQIDDEFGSFGTSNITISYLASDGNFHALEGGGPFTVLTSKTIEETATTTYKATMAGATGGESVFIEFRDLARG